MKPPVDFVIVAALQEERDAVLDRLPGARQLPPTPEDVRKYFACELPATFPDGNTCTYRLIVMSLLDMGRVEAAIATSDAIRYWQPRFVLLVGIAGGIVSSNVGLGDVLVSDQIVDYELQKLTPEGPEVRYKVHRADPALLGAAQGYRSTDWQRDIETNRPTKGTPQRKVGPIATGDKVVAFSDVLTSYQKSWPKLIGFEMEAGGVASACFEAKPSPGFFMVRAVSDLADKNKNTSAVKKWRPYACDVAACYTIGLLKSGPVVPVDTPRSPELKDLIVEACRRVDGGHAPLGLSVSQAEHIADILTSGRFVNVERSPRARRQIERDLQDNYPRRSDIQVLSFNLLDRPVTVKMFQLFCKDSSYRTRAERDGEDRTWRSVDISDREDHPVTFVAYEDALAFCEWVEKVCGFKEVRVPSSVEYEYAARGGKEDRLFPWGNEWELNKCNDIYWGGHRDTSPFNQFEHGRSAHGIWDLCGNVFEWLGDSVPSEAGFRMTAGGSFRRAAIYWGYASSRGFAPEYAVSEEIGFRIIVND